ncbi:hypothetical protein DFQ30_004437 [Apophysomyces sp. BC1015]|nr:hypothetical protein DFQ30_004437 [Apophysomyces sp. BC1015]KAG0178386.1 hypothetical protein DFQ29_003532 [Apophysomyces sp. BC1021]
MDGDPSPTPLPLQFQLLYNWEASAKNDALLKNKTRMYPAFKAELNHVPIYRLIDYEFENHYISAGQLWRASGLTVTEGLFLFKLMHSDYEVDFLVPGFPFCDIWVDVAKAKTMARTLGVDVELQQLLADMPVFSSDNPARCEIVHNWKVDSIPNALYSTRALLESEFNTVDPLNGNQKIRTQISRSKQSGLVMKDRLETGLMRWQIWAYERFLDNGNNENESVNHVEEHNAMWDVLQGLLCDLQTIVRQGAELRECRVLSDNMMVGNMALKREFLGQSRSLQNVYIAVMAEKIYNEIELVVSRKAVTDPVMDKDSEPAVVETIVRETHPASSTMSSKTDMNGVGGDSQMMLHDRMDALEQELYRIKRKMRKKSDSMYLKQQELLHQITALEAWKTRNEKSRKSERVWMLVLMISIFFGIWSTYN